jgi:anti-anti-sigma factor
MTIKAKQNILFVKGSIKGVYEAKFQKALNEFINKNSEKSVIIDMSKVDHMSSHALAAIIHFRKTMPAVQISIRNPSEQVNTLLKITNLNKIIRVLRPKPL